MKTIKLYCLISGSYNEKIPVLRNIKQKLVEFVDKGYTQVLHKY